MQEIPIIGIRRVIAQRMSEAARSIPHFSYVEEVDISALHAMREHLNSSTPKGAAPLSYLPFIAAALVRALKRYPQCNAHYDAAREIVIRHARGAHRDCHADQRGSEGAGGAQCRSAESCGRSPPRSRRVTARRARSFGASARN